MAKCKRCSLKTVLSDDDIAKTVDEVTHMKNIRLADTEQYNDRFNICRQCNNFMHGSTCAKCGCIMQVRARLADGRCPEKKWH